MPLAIDRDQKIVFAHRTNFVGKPTGPSTVSWDYKGDEHVIVRPDDGQPAKPWQVKCKECRKNLEFTVHSVAATRRRQARWRAIAWTGLAVLIASVAGCVVIGGAALAVLIPAAIVGAATGYYVGGIAADEMGITGNGAGMPIVAKHSVTLVESRPAGMEELVCAKCGHEEEFTWGSHLRKGVVERRYQEAKARLDAHTCRAK
ncbi:hypothetical protein E1287_36035 [Actinomadura sp. KC06]|uniref:hypothetical protein n=1 Tax=Actinomadura sp. KC06 TaxID=2530369 RepID=UPI00104B1836|nr:hypothetical protein [Actinomadura sp. KC06]TDD26712.1 hypothetical protein E1287_36035 [Actinomadura sp. KC06]